VDLYKLFKKEDNEEDNRKIISQLFELSTSICEKDMELMFPRTVIAPSIIPLVKYLNNDKSRGNPVFSLPSFLFLQSR